MRQAWTAANRPAFPLETNSLVLPFAPMGTIAGNLLLKWRFRLKGNQSTFSGER